MFLTRGKSCAPRPPLVRVILEAEFAVGLLDLRGLGGLLHPEDLVVVLARQHRGDEEEEAVQGGEVRNHSEEVYHRAGLK